MSNITEGIQNEDVNWLLGQTSKSSRTKYYTFV